MLIVNADDWGRNTTSTDNTMVCFKNGRITSVSAMVFMEDSKRAAALALKHGLDAGLHLNFTTKFDQNIISSKLLECQQRITAFLQKNKYYFLLYNPVLKETFITSLVLNMKNIFVCIIRNQRISMDIIICTSVRTCFFKG